MSENKLLIKLAHAQHDLFYAEKELKKCRAEMKRQYRRRKFALSEMRRWKAASECINTDCTYNYKQAEKFKKRIGELLVILQKHEIAV